MNRYTFKAKRKDNNEWVYGDLLNLYDGRKYIVNNQFGACIDNKGNFINTEAPFTNEIITETLCQCTGLKDRDGKDIFENDIVENYWGSEKQILDVRYYECGLVFTDRKDGSHRFISNAKIIGNKFDKEED